MTLLLLQMSIVLLVAVVCGRLARQLGQPRVIGEIIGGIMIGPSVFGRFAPHLSADLFPSSSLAQLELLSTVGLVLFLFLIGMELDYAQLYHQRGTTIAASGASIFVPFVMAAVLAHSLRIRFAPHGIGSIPFVLFLGIAMSITAFPVLARILEERNLQSTPLGTIAILSAAVNDVIGWLLLALALALVGEAGGPSSLPLRLLGLLNTRGLVELIVLNIAYNVGAFTPTLFTMMVVMALVTTMCTAPVLNLLGIRDGRTKAAPVDHAHA